MNTAIINFRIDPKLKKDAQKIADKMGLPLAYVIKCFLRDLVNTKKVTFNVDEEPSDYLIKVLKKSFADVKTGRVSPSFTNTKDAIAWLNAPDKQNLSGTKKQKYNKKDGHKVQQRLQKTLQKSASQNQSGI